MLGRVVIQDGDRLQTQLRPALQRGYDGAADLAGADDDHRLTPPWAVRALPAQHGSADGYQEGRSAPAGQPGSMRDRAERAAARQHCHRPRAEVDQTSDERRAP